ncbi:MAG: hypothetical protein WD830_06380 [Chloroflexota bacterium]
MVGCSSECGPNASCPALAWVGGQQYAIGSGENLINVEGALTPIGSRDSTNSSAYFADQTVFQLGSVDPSAVMVARASAEIQPDLGPFLVLWGPNEALAYPGICQYFADNGGMPSGCASPEP